MPKFRSVRCLIPLLLSVAVGTVGSAGDRGSLPGKLTPDTYEAVKSRVNLTPQDLAWQQVRWRDGFFEGLLEAQAQDKPIFLWFYGGGPTGNC